MEYFLGSLFGGFCILSFDRAAITAIARRKIKSIVNLPSSWLSRITNAATSFPRAYYVTYSTFLRISMTFSTWLVHPRALKVLTATTMACPPITYPAIIATRVTATHLCLLLVKYPAIITGIAPSMGYEGCRRAYDRAAVVIRKCER